MLKQYKDKARRMPGFLFVGQLVRSCAVLRCAHPAAWIPACAGMTEVLIKFTVIPHRRTAAKAGIQTAGEAPRRTSYTLN